MSQIDASITIYHNPRCSKSRETLNLIRGKGIEPRIVEYLKTPPDAATLAVLLERLGLTPRQLIRTGEPLYRELGLNDPDLPDTRLIEAMSEHPRLIQRPIVIRGERAVLGRPPEQVLEVL